MSLEPSTSEKVLWVWIK